jgi:hypothetical protein
LQSPAIYLMSQQAYQDELGTLPTFLAAKFQNAERIKVLPFLRAVQERRIVKFPILVEGLDYLLLNTYPDEREDVMMQIKQILSMAMAVSPHTHVLFLLRDSELSEREIPRTVVLRRRGGGDEIPLHAIFPSARRETLTSASGKTYFRFASLGS